MALPSVSTLVNHISPWLGSSHELNFTNCLCVCVFTLCRGRAGWPTQFHLQSGSQQVSECQSVLSLLSLTCMAVAVSSREIERKAGQDLMIVLHHSVKSWHYLWLCFYWLLVMHNLPLSFLLSHPPSRLSSTASGSDNLFGPPLESAFKSKSFAGREQLPRAESVFGASECKYG